MEVSDFNECSGGNVNIAPFVITIYTLATRKDLSHLRLGQVFIFPQVSNSAIIRHNYTTLLWMYLLYLRKFFAIDF